MRDCSYFIWDRCDSNFLGAVTNLETLRNCSDKPLCNKIVCTIYLSLFYWEKEREKIICWKYLHCLKQFLIAKYATAVFLNLINLFCLICEKISWFAKRFIFLFSIIFIPLYKVYLRKFCICRILFSSIFDIFLFFSF